MIQKVTIYSYQNLWVFLVLVVVPTTVVIDIFLSQTCTTTRISSSISASKSSSISSFLFPFLKIFVLAELNTVATLQNDPRVSTFVRQLDRLGISSTIGTTILAPSDDAYEEFEQYYGGKWRKFTQQPEYFIHLRDLHLWHLIIENNKLTIQDIFDGRRNQLGNSVGNITINQQLQTLDGIPIIINTTNTTATTTTTESSSSTSSSIVEANIPTSTAYIHIINEIIIPPYMTMNMIENLLQDRSDTFAFTTMANIALWAELDDELNRVHQHGITFLVPPNRRFNRAEIDVPKLLTEPMRSYTRDFVLCHMIKRNYYKAGIFAYTEELEANVGGEDEEGKQFLVTSMLGTHMWITTTENILRFQSTKVLLADQVTNDGIFHGIDYPLTPPYASDFAELTPLSTSWDTTDCFRFFAETLLTTGDIANMFNTSINLWCPTTTAFDFFNNEDFNRLLEPIWVRHATEFLLNHMSAPAMTRLQYVQMAPGSITMLNGATYELRKSGPRPRIKNGPIEQARSDFGDIISVDGYMHIIDSVITPTALSRSIYDHCNEHPDFSLLVENIDFVDLTDIVDRDLPLTMLAPNNNAWRRIVFSTLDGPEIIRRHLFRGLLFMDVIANSTQLTAVNGISLSVETRGEFNESLYVGGAYIYQGDILAWNGVLHYIDRVVGVEYPTSVPTVSPAPTITAYPTQYIPPTSAPVPTTAVRVPILLPPVNRPTLPTANNDEGEEDDGPSSPKSSATTTSSSLLWSSLGIINSKNVVLLSLSVWMHPMTIIITMWAVLFE